MQYRTYGPERLRFLQVDPAAEKYTGLSPYVYALGNPLRIIDPDGRIGYTVNRKDGSITRINDDGGDKVDYFTIGSTNDDGDFKPMGERISVERGGGAIVSFRFGETESGTKSAFIVPETNQTGFVLEPPGPATTVRDQNRRIPEGAYNIARHRGKKFKDHFKLHNEEVPLDRDIVLHMGKTVDHTIGCLIICRELDGYVVTDGDSHGDALTELNSYLKSGDYTKMMHYIYNIIPEEEE